MEKISIYEFINFSILFFFGHMPYNKLYSKMASKSQFIRSKLGQK